MKRIEPLSDAECETLRAAWKEGPNSRVRQRAQAVYLYHFFIDLIFSRLIDSTTTSL